MDRVIDQVFFKVNEATCDTDNNNIMKKHHN
jgi:hypothetical protein